MSSDQPKSWVQITVASLGAVGLIGAAILGNWHNLGLGNRGEKGEGEDDPGLRRRYTSEVKTLVESSMISGKEAYWNLDPSLLEEVFIEGAFKLLEQNIAQHNSMGYKIDRNSSNIQYSDITFTNKPLMAEVSFSRSLRIYVHSLKSETCIHSTPKFRQELTYSLQRDEKNEWKVFAIVSHTDTPQEKLPC